MIKNKYAKLALCAALCAALSPAVGTSASILNLGGSLGNIGQIIPSQPQQLANYKFSLDGLGYVIGIEKIAPSVPLNETVVILSKQDGVTIRGVHSRAFSKAEGVKKVIFSTESQATYIGAEAFAGTKDLTTIDFTNSKVNFIANRALADCPKLAEVRIPSTISQIREDAFANSPNLTDIYIDAKEDSIPGAPWGATKAKIHWLK